jgi:hypothetical protein
MIALDRTRLTGRLFFYALRAGSTGFAGTNPVHESGEAPGKKDANLEHLAGAKTRRED